MVEYSKNPEAFGRPGIEPRWTHANKYGVGTAYSADSKVWFTIFRGTVTEVYFPTIDSPQLRDVQLLFSDGKTFFHEEKRNFSYEVELISPHALGYKITSTESSGMYKLHKEVISSPHSPCLLQKIRIEGEKELLERIQVYVLCSPHLGGGGYGNNAYVVRAAGRDILVANKEGTWLALMASVPFSKVSCGFAGRTDGKKDLLENYQMDYEFGRATNGNVALTGHLDLKGGVEFTLALAFGRSLHNAITNLFQSLGEPFEDQKSRFVNQWNRAYNKMLSLGRGSKAGGHLYHSSYSLLLAHEDKSFPGAFIASLTIPWGEAMSDEDRGGYHLVWTRDMVKTVTALLAAGNLETPLRALIYLAASQREDGAFPQNFWIGGDPYWGGIQLDEVAFPVMLAWKLYKARALRDFDPYAMVTRGASYLIQHAPVTEQERWEEMSGFSPSTIASNIAALICAADFARGRGEEATARYLEDFSDFLESHLEEWTVTTEGTLVPEIKKHYIRVSPAKIDDPEPEADPNNAKMIIPNHAPGEHNEYYAREIIDVGFLELVRYGIRAPEDPLIVDSLKVVDAVLKVDTPAGPCWRRYNHDGYGQRSDGGPYIGWGRGRAWPLLTGERGHYELAAGNDAGEYIRIMERFATKTGMLPEQIWDEKDIESQHLRLGGPTGSATPLMWAHSEYIQLLRSVSDGKPFDLIPQVRDRYITDRSKSGRVEFWKQNYRLHHATKGSTLRIQIPSEFLLHWSLDNWTTRNDSKSTPTSLGVDYVDIDIPSTQAQPIVFTIYYPSINRWEGRDYSVAVV
ncbi:MAG: glucan 1,4-alpha-glucosidase [Nitrososphaerota archaeon]|nr:glucan 1,4-alpha-glucosidase [Nitrososphaerota archaeon]